MKKLLTNLKKPLWGRFLSINSLPRVMQDEAEAICNLIISNPHIMSSSIINKFNQRCNQRNFSGHMVRIAISLISIVVCLVFIPTHRAEAGLIFKAPNR